MAMAEKSFSVTGTSTVASAQKTQVEPDVIIVLLAAEKKGLFLKHSEYEVSRRTNRTISKAHDILIPTCFCFFNIRQNV